MNVSGTAKEALFMAGLQATQKESATAEQALEANQAEASSEKLQAEQETTVNVSIRTTKLSAPEKSAKTEKAEKAQESVLVRKEEADGLADGFSRRQGNQEYHLDPHSLSALAQDLGESLSARSTPEEMLTLINQRMSSINPKTGVREPPLASHVQKAFEFILEVAKNKLGIAPKEAKENIQSTIDHLEIAQKTFLSTHAEEIRQTEALLNLADQVVTDSGLPFKETVKEMRDMVNNPKDVQAMRKNAEVEGGYSQMIRKAKELYRYIGDALKNTRMENPEIARVIASGRELRSAIQVLYRSDAHLRAMVKYLTRNGILERS